MSQKIKINQISGYNSNEYYRNFINSCKSEATKRDYRKGLGYFMDYTSIEPEDYAKLIEGRDVRIIQSYIINWITHMKDTAGLSPASIKLYTAGAQRC
jgi:hypothetical protein